MPSANVVTVAQVNPGFLAARRKAWRMSLNRLCT
jgi:hypothetical protein